MQIVYNHTKLEQVLKQRLLGFDISHVNCGDDYTDMREEAFNDGLIDSEDYDQWFSVYNITFYNT